MAQQDHTFEQDMRPTQCPLAPNYEWRMFPKLFKFPKSQCPDVWIHFSRHKRPKSWSNIKEPEVLLERTLQGHRLAGLLWERQFEEVLLGLGWEKYQIGNVCVLIENKDYTSSQQVFERGLQSIKFSCDPLRWDADANDNGLNGRCIISGFVH